MIACRLASALPSRKTRGPRQLLDYFNCPRLENTGSIGLPKGGSREVGEPRPKMRGAEATGIRMNFASDNAAGVAPEILSAIARANDGPALAYGNDAITKRVERRFAELFEREVAVFLVPTGTAANALALAHLSPPWGAVLCHAESHVTTDECGAPEFFGGGLKLIGLAGEAGKIAPEAF